MLFGLLNSRKCRILDQSRASVYIGFPEMRDIFVIFVKQDFRIKEYDRADDLRI